MRCDSQVGLDTEDSLPTRHSLLSRLKNWDDSESWNDFFSTYWRLIFNVARKAGLTEAEAQDVVQLTVIEVSNRIGDFKRGPNRGSFKRWLLQMTRWRIADQFRRRFPAEEQAGRGLEDDDETNFLDRIPDPAGSPLDQTWDAEWEANLFRAAVERVKETVNPKHYQVFDAYVFQEWPMEKIHRLFDLSPNHVRVLKTRILRLIKKEMECLEKRVP